MKKRILIICSIIGVLLAGFQFPIYAETTPPDYSSSTSIMSSTPLDQYFYDNYELLPYIESDGSQYINTNVLGSNNLRINFSGSGFVKSDDNQYLFGARRLPDSLGIYLKPIDDYALAGVFSASYERFNSDLSYFNRINVNFDKNKLYINNNLVKTFDISEFDLNNIYIFALNYNNEATWTSSFKLYNFSIYDYGANDGEGALVRDYYPARSKSGGVIGLYDAVSKTFVTTSGSVPFASPVGDPVNLSLGANITQFLSGSLSWIGAIFEGINEMPIIWIFIAIALAGVMFRWARRIVHF